ncbi:MAG: YdcF family protein [Isosphaeraceae bacterium]
MNPQAAIGDSRYSLAPGPMLPTPINPGWRRLQRAVVRLIVVAVAAGVLVLVHRPLLAGFADLFRVDNPAPSDAIVVLLGGPGHRPERAAALYREGLAPVILVCTSGYDSAAHQDETAMYLKTLTQLGVPRQVIQVLPDRVTSTRDEAQRVRDLARLRPWRRIIVITTAFHTARARWVFRKVLRGTGIDVRMAAAGHPQFQESNWYRSDEGLVLYFSEAIKTLYYWLIY